MINTTDLEVLKIPISTRKRKYSKISPEIASKRRIFELIDETEDKMTDIAQIARIETEAARDKD